MWKTNDFQGKRSSFMVQRGVFHIYGIQEAMYQRPRHSLDPFGFLRTESRMDPAIRELLCRAGNGSRDGARKMTIVGSTNDPLRISWNSKHDCEPMIKVCGNTPKGKNQEIMLLGNGIRNLVVGTWHCPLLVRKMPDQIAASRSDRIWPILLLLVASSI